MYLADFAIQVTARGNWKDPRNAEQLGSAMTAIHVQRGHGGAYEEPCRACLLKFEQDEATPGCEEHFYNRSIRRRGNPRLDVEMQSMLKRHYIKQQDYVPQSDSALTPLELIGQLSHWMYCISARSRTGHDQTFQFCVITLAYRRESSRPATCC